MKKKIISIFVIIVISICFYGCGKKGEKQNTDITNNKAEITIYIPEGQKIDKKYKDDKNIAINYLPKINGEFSDEQINNIANNIDKHVKVLIITSNNNGLAKVYEKVKKKLPGVITIASDINEFNNNALDDILKNTNIDVGLSVKNSDSSLVSAKLSKMMNSSRFVYLHLDDELDYKDFEETKSYCEKNKIEFQDISLGKAVDDKIFNDKIKSIGNIENTAIYPASKNLSEIVLKNFTKYRYIIPNLNSEKDGELFAKTFDLVNEYESMSRLDFEKKISNKLSEENLSGKLGIIYEEQKSIPTILSIEIANYMYEKNYMIEECYRDVSLVARGNQTLDLDIVPIKIGASYGYLRYLNITPRIY